MKRILLIEDDRYLTDDLQYFIEDAGNKCKVYSTADQVMENFDSIEDYDIIVLDIMMMKGEKIETVDKDTETGEVLYMKIRKKFPKKKVIIISAKDYDHMKIDFKKENYVDTLQKPSGDQFIEDLLRLIGS